ncbi:UNVERIFIED_CONTAM: putative leucine-rich repeat receptor-like serine/threonine-protein kinase [Sesamum radiatum]|uniref:Leucine-rich repeat receptor-like serine/threonine-protein kinase n=1 Tax=Sesamum radiatum TaxID=300843 RepID=A0AAW2T5N1_SESRA
MITITCVTMLLPRLIALVCVVRFASGQPVLPADEVESLQVIARSLGKRDWNFSVDPCSGLSGWATQNPVKGFENALTCDCTFANNTICHVVSIILKAQNLNGSVPRELIRLPFLQEIDLTRNYLNGTIPPEWGSMKLVNISLLGNRVTGSIPKELANITTLANLTLEYNQLSGTIPPELGDLPRIERLRIGDNNFIGSIPGLIQNWTNIEKLVIQASGLAGPIPSGIASLTKLTDLRISDLNGNESTFPPLSNIKKLKTLILRSCNIVGELPSYIGEMTGLKVLDLSFNKLSGPIPDSFVGLSNTDYIYLTGNSLTGPLPPWMLKDGDSINLFASSKANSSGIVSCLRSFRCERRYYSLHINCGGRQAVDDKGTIYEDDSNSGGPSSFVLSKTNWGFSSTGHFLDDDRPRDSFIWSNSSSISGRIPSCTWMHGFPPYR